MQKTKKNGDNWRDRGRATSVILCKISSFSALFDQNCRASGVEVRGLGEVMSLARTERQVQAPPRDTVS